MEQKTVSVKDAASLLGVSDFTIRRRIQENQLEAVMDSKKHGYRITLDSIIKYAKEHQSQIGTLWANTPIVTMTPKNSILATVANIAANKVLGTKLPIVGSIASSLKNSFRNEISINLSKENNESDDLTNLDNPVIIDKVIDRLKAEMSDLDLQIELQQLKIDQLPVEDKEALFSEKEKLLNIKQLKSNINKDIKDLEIQKAILNQNKGNS